jgi:hypothetical protein
MTSSFMPVPAARSPAHPVRHLETLHQVVDLDRVGSRAGRAELGDLVFGQQLHVDAVDGLGCPNCLYC